MFLVSSIVFLILGKIKKNPDLQYYLTLPKVVVRVSVMNFCNIQKNRLGPSNCYNL